VKRGKKKIVLQIQAGGKKKKTQKERGEGGMLQSSQRESINRVNCPSQGSPEVAYAVYLGRRGEKGKQERRRRSCRR